MNVIETERLILRRLTIEDAGDLYRIYSDPETMEFMIDNAASVEDVRSAIGKHIDTYYKVYGFGLWATVLKENNALIGRCGLLSQEIDGVKELELAALIGSNYWGQGLAAEAARAIVKLGFEKYGANRIIAVIFPQNTNSIRLAERIGMKFQREIDQYRDFGRILLYALDS